MIHFKNRRISTLTYVRWIDRLHLLANIRGQQYHITIQLITKHFTSYSDGDAEKGKG